MLSCTEFNCVEIYILKNEATESQEHVHDEILQNLEMMPKQDEIQRESRQ